MGRKPSLITGAAASFVLSLVCAYRAIPRTRPDLEVLPASRDFGKVFQKNTVRAEFKLTNRQSYPLRVVEVLKDCDCAEVRLEKTTLRAGESATLTATCDTRTKRGRSATAVEVIYDDGPGTGTVRSARLRMVAEVVPDHDCRPSELLFHSGTGAEQIIAFTPVHLKDLRLLRAYCSHPAFQARLVSNCEVAVHFDPRLWRDEPRGSRAYLIAETNSQAEPEFHVALRIAGSDSPEVGPIASSNRPPSRAE